ncbi:MULTISPECIES: class I SAM-dependent methyltransferase [unclassified Kitasatospora]|uniref:class I SAM-dependent methyltransferase n=1 Tax=unclassified Kitasatospora TaxID=2633591 RepID=UPI00070AD870|nr:MULTISPECIES: class I SAM-dependent methyltransferase [unclassified Kitasatospora]KQV17505.1 hypothetical protein ASC99_25360 [Kitasatospora sp. Root107]KRB69248.1 hypothetical protein ASE03_27815 [Kitasatospora sp. Root187]
MTAFLGRDSFAPLDAQQTLHLFDALTWFPTDRADVWQRAADHVGSHATHAPRPAPRDCRAVAARVLAGAAPDATALYRAKYEVMTALYPDDWFTFMNLGYCDDPPVPDRPSGYGDPVWQFAARHYELTAGQIDLAGAEVLDVGSGRGGGTAFIARTHRPRSILGLDHTRAGTAFSRRVHRAPGLAFQCGDAERLPFPDRSFDAVLTVETMHCLADADRFLREVARVLRPGGHLLLADEWPAVDRPLSRVAAAGLGVVAHLDITEGVVRALDRLPERAQELVSRLPEGPEREVYRRFFHQRLCRDSGRNLRSGRFGYLRLHAVKEG